MHDARALMRWSAWAVLAAVPVGFMGLFFVWPVTAVIIRGLGGAGAGGVADLVGSASFWRVLWFTTWQAAASTVLTDTEAGLSEELWIFLLLLALVLVVAEWVTYHRRLTV